MNQTLRSKLAYFGDGAPSSSQAGVSGGLTTFEESWVRSWMDQSVSTQGSVVAQSGSTGPSRRGRQDLRPTPIFQAQSPDAVDHVDVIDSTTSPPQLSVRDIEVFNTTPERAGNATEKGFVRETGQLASARDDPLGPWFIF